MAKSENESAENEISWLSAEKLEEKMAERNVASAGEEAERKA
jgi:hypothetical protein